VATGRELLRFMSVMAPPNCGGTLAPCLLTSASFAELTSKPSVSRGQSVWYGFGFQAKQSQGDFNLWHAGSLPGTLTNFIRASTGYSWTLLFNRRSKEMEKTQDALGWEAHQCVGNNWPSNFVGPPPKTTPDALTVAVCPGSECKLSGQSCLEGDGYCCGTDLRWREGMCAPLTTPTTPTTTLAPATAPPGVNWTCSLSDIVMANYCSSGYPFIAASHDCHYSWYSSSASDAVSSCTNAAGYTCYVYDQYGTRCR